MSRIDTLIAELCSDGVEYRKLGDASNYIRGITYNKHQESLDGEGWRVLRANNIDLFSGTLSFNDVRVIKNEVNIPHAKLLRAGDVFICAGSGSKSHVGKVAFVDEDLPFTFGGFMGVIRVDSQDILPKFVYHVLRSDLFRSYLKVALDSTTINNLNAKIVNAFEIPVPPIKVQREIVRILDTFAALTDELIDKLMEEAAARKAQHAHYRDRLLSRESLEALDGKPIEYRKLVSLTNIVYGFPFSSESFNDREGTPLIRIRDVMRGHSGTFYQGEFDQAYVIHAGDILVGMDGDFNVGKWKSNDALLNQRVLKIEVVSAESINNDFLFHLLGPLLKKVNDSIQASTVKHLTVRTLKTIEIPVPSLETQQRVVDILDRFDALTTSLTDGIPAEIEARKAQYAYYRDRLLDFPRRTI